jgi:signal transduction histidine kinase/ActR/RegA family two-component response regulator
MNHEQVLATISATVGVLVALLTLGLARAPGCRGLQWLGAIAFCAGAISALRTMAESLTHERDIVQMTQVGMALSGIMLWSWVKYEASGQERPGRLAERALGPIALIFVALSVVPSLLVSSTIIRHGDGWSTVSYVDAVPTPLGAAVLAGTMVVATMLLIRYARRWRAGEPMAGAHTLGLAGLLAAGAYDSVDGTWSHSGMHMLPIGLLWAIGAVGVALVGRFVRGARELEDVSVKLAQAMAERTAELATAQADLVETRELAILGRLSAAVAHEINNPVAVVAANLSFLRDALASSTLAATEEMEAMQDTLVSVDRIASIVRQLGDAGELAGHGSTIFPVGLASVVAGAAATARVRVADASPVVVDVAAVLFVSSQEASLRQVLASLIASSMEAIRQTEAHGQVRISAHRKGDRMLVRVQDDAPEQDDILRERRFKPYLDPRPELVRNDVGLSVSLALLRMLGAEITLERSDDSGSVVCVDLRATAAPASQSDAPASARTPRARILVVDDDVLTRIGLRRLLGREYLIEEAGSVVEALEAIHKSPGELDAIVCDVVMPDGGAEALIEALTVEDEPLAASVLLLTGGAVDPASGSFLAREAHRAIRKPVDLSVLRTMIEKVRLRRSPSTVRSSGA